MAKMVAPEGKIIIKLLDTEEKTSSGIAIVSNNQSMDCVGVVVCGVQRDEDEVIRVCVDKRLMVPFKFDGEQFFAVRKEDVLCFLKDDEEEE